MLVSEVDKGRYLTIVFGHALYSSYLSTSSLYDWNKQGTSIGAANAAAHDIIVAKPKRS